MFIVSDTLHSHLWLFNYCFDVIVINENVDDYLDIREIFGPSKYELRAI